MFVGAGASGTFDVPNYALCWDRVRSEYSMIMILLPGYHHREGQPAERGELIRGANWL